MTEVAELLENIGAGELPTRIELPKHVNGAAHFGSILERLESEIDHVNNETRDVLARNWPLFSQQVATGKRLLDGLSDEERLLDHLEARMNGPLVPNLKSKIEQHAKLSADHAFATASVELMTSLADLHDRVSTLSGLVSDGALASAVKHVPVLKATQQAVPNWVTQTAACETLAKWATDETARLEESLVRAFESCFYWDGTPGHGNFRIQARVRPVDGPRAEEMHVRAILDDLHTLWSASSRQGRIDKLLAALCNKLLEHVLLPVIRGEANITYHPSPPTAVVDPQPSSDVLANVSSFLAFLAMQTTLLSSSFARAVTVVLTPAVQKAIVSDFLPRSLPFSCADLPSYFEIVNDACQFEQFLNDKGWFAHFPAEQVDIEERRLIRDWSERVGHHWAKNIGTDVLDRLRRDVKLFKWQATAVEVKVPVPREPTPPPSPIVQPPSPVKAASPVVATPVIQHDEEEDSESHAQAIKPKRGKQKLGTKVIKKDQVVLPPADSDPTNTNGNLLSPDSAARPRAPSIGSAGSGPSADVDDAWGFDIDDDLATEEAGAPVAMSSSQQHTRSPDIRSPASGGHDEDAATLDEEGWGFDADEGEDEDEESLIGVPNPIASPKPRSPSLRSANQNGSSRRSSNVSDLPPPVPVHEPAAEGEDDAEDEEAGWGWDDQPLSIASSPLVGRNSPRMAPVDKAMTLPTVTPPRKSSTSMSREPEFRTETMLVSDLSRTLVDYCSQVLQELVQVQGMQLPSSFDSAVPMLRQAFFSVLSMYRAVMPVQHQKALSTVSAIAMQFSNDAKWIADEVARLPLSAEALTETDVTQAATAMTTLSTEWRLVAIKTQKDDMWQSLDETHHFLDTADDARYATCERALQQVVHTLNHTAQAWKPVVSATVLYTTLGELVNDVLQRVLDDIEGQVDISEEESIRLNKLCKQLHELEQIFEGSHTSVGREVPVWFKFVFLSELLEASMADIIFLFDHGHLVDFSIQEIAKLVRALFSDSPLRQKNLEHIMRGHPDPNSVEYD